MEGGGCSRYPLYHGLAGTFEGQGYEIRDLFINRPEEGAVGLLAYLVEGGIIGMAIIQSRFNSLSASAQGGQE